MRVLGLVCVLLFSSSCLVEGDRKSKKESKALIDVGGDEENSSVPWSKCEKYLTQGEDSTPYGSSHIIYKDYKHKKSCVRLLVGLYGSLQRHEMDGSPTAGGLFTQTSSGSFKAAKSFLEGRGITCKESNKQLSLAFPDRQHGHSDYKSVNLQCGTNVKQLIVRIGLQDEDSNEMAITVVPRRDDDVSPVFHAFDTDSRGVIKKHVKVVGYGGEKEIVLKNYKKQ